MGAGSMRRAGGAGAAETQGRRQDRSRTTDRPHIVIFNPDQWRGDTLAHLGHPAVRTPQLDSLVATDA